jgi:hypothetical protein
MAAGDFTASQQALVIERQEDLWKDPRNKKLYEPKIASLTETLAMQTANVSILTDSPRNQVAVSFLDASAITTQGCADDCNPDGVLLQSKAVPVTLTQCVEATPFKVEVPVGDNDPKSAYAQNIYKMAGTLALGMLKADKEICEKLAQANVAKIAASAGVNSDTLGEYGDVVAGTNTTIPAANWNADIFPYFQLEAELNRFGAPYMLHGRNLYLDKLNAVPNAQNDDQRDQQAKYELIESAWDPFTFSKLGLGNVSLMVDAGAYAFATRNVYGPQPDKIEANTTIYSVQSRFIPSVRMDVLMKRICVTGIYYDVVVVKVPYFDGIVNPANGLAGDTGMLKFTRGA